MKNTEEIDNVFPLYGEFEGRQYKAERVEMPPTDYQILLDIYRDGIYVGLCGILLTGEAWIGPTENFLGLREETYLDWFLGKAIRDSGIRF